MTTFASWVIAPVALLLIAGAVGLLAERVARSKLPDGLLVPIGTLVLVLVVLPVYLLDFDALVAGCLTLALTLVAVWSGRRDVLRAVRTPAAIAGLLGYVLYLAPVLLTGHWTWSGYNFVNDPSVNFVIIDHIAHAGDAPATGGPSTAVQVINGTLGVSYPLGAHALLATLDWLVPVTLPALYQPFIAFFGAIAAMAFFELARACRLPPVVATVAAVAAIGAGVTYNYALHGAFKEIALVACLATAAALARVALDARLAAGPVALMAISLAAGVAIISSVAGAYALVLAAVLLVAALAVERRRVDARTIGVAALVGSAVLVLAISPFLKDAIAFGRTAGTQFGSNTTDGPSVLAHLLRPLPIYQGLGVWLRDDYRYPLEPGTLKTLTTALCVVVAALLALGAFAELRARRWAALLAFVPALAVYAFAAPRLSPYAEAKLLVVLGPTVVFMAAIGGWWLFGKAKVAGGLAAVLLVGGVLATDALAYRYTQLAPPDRMVALEDAVEHTTGGRWMAPEWEEFAKYYGDDISLDIAPEAYSPSPAQLRVPGPWFHRSFDLDSLVPEYVQQWQGLLLRRGPESSHPPLNFERIYQNAYYELWRKDPHGPRVLEHIALGTDQQQAAKPTCAAVGSLAARLRPGERIVAASARVMPELDPVKQRPRGWAGSDDIPDVLVPKGQGRVRGQVEFAGGEFRAWVRGGAERKLSISVDGKLVGQASGTNSPGSWLSVGTMRVERGRHEVTLWRPGGGFGPGDASRGLVGRVVFEPLVPQRVVTVSKRDVYSLCSGEWDWVERVAP